jgi:predicted kinase
MAECVILIGLPGAGKTTFYWRHFATTHRHVSKDLWPNARQREARQRRILGDTLSRGESVVVDNTNPSRGDREPLIATARAHHARVIGYFFDVSTREAVARNAGRAGRNNVPNVAIFAAAKRLQPPAFAEGFDQLFIVHPLPDYLFTIRECDRPAQESSAQP